jgi:hypothetical protein
VKIKEKVQWRGHPPHLSKSASGSKSTATCRPSSETFKLDNPRPPGQRRAAFIFAKVINRSAAISGAYHAPAQTHDLPRLSHIGLHLLSPKALHRPLSANTIGSSLCCIRCSQLMDCILPAPEMLVLRSLESAPGDWRAAMVRFAPVVRLRPDLGLHGLDVRPGDDDVAFNARMVSVVIALRCPTTVPKQKFGERIGTIGILRALQLKRAR